MDTVTSQDEPGRPDDDGASLMLRFQRGDDGAFEEIVRRYQRLVLNAVFRHVGNRSTAEELTQEVFLRVFGARDSYERKARFETWLFRILFNLCANAAEHGRRRRALSLQAAPGEGGGSAPREEAGPTRGATLTDGTAVDPLRGVEASEEREQVRRAVAALPEQQRAALILHRWQALPLQEIAVCLGTSAEAVKSLLFRARENLRDALAPYLRAQPRCGEAPAAPARPDARRVDER